MSNVSTASASAAPAKPIAPVLAPPIVSVQDLSKIYAGGLHALKRVNLDIRRGEIFALLGPNGAGKTTLISIICGITKASEGRIFAAGHDMPGVTTVGLDAARILEHLAPRARGNRSGAARITHRLLRIGVGDDEFLARLVW